MLQLRALMLQQRFRTAKKIKNKMTLILLEVDQYSFNNENFRILELSRVVVVTHSQARYSDLEKKI